jgi:hypothetical protein
MESRASWWHNGWYRLIGRSVFEDWLRAGRLKRCWIYPWIWDLTVNSDPLSWPKYWNVPRKSAMHTKVYLVPGGRINSVSICLSHFVLYSWTGHLKRMSGLYLSTFSLHEPLKKRFTFHSSFNAICNFVPHVWLKYRQRRWGDVDRHSWTIPVIGQVPGNEVPRPGSLQNFAICQNITLKIHIVMEKSLGTRDLEILQRTFANFFNSYWSASFQFQFI